MSVKLQVDRADLMGLEKAFKEMRTRSTERVGKIIKGAAIVARNEAVVTAPKDTGRLKGSIRFLVEGDGLEAWIYTNVHYAYWQNEGSSKMKGKFFMQKGHAAARRYMIKKIKKSDLGL